MFQAPHAHASGDHYPATHCQRATPHGFPCCNICLGNIGRDDPNSKANHEDQWWELHDINTERSYYYNATNHTTEWERPATGDIVQLAKLQVRYTVT